MRALQLARSINSKRLAVLLCLVGVMGLVRALAYPVPDGAFLLLAFWLLVVDVIVLGFCGANPPEGIWLVLSRIATAWYFFHFLILVPIIARTERPKPLPFSISEPVVKTAGARA